MLDLALIIWEKDYHGKIIICERGLLNGKFGILVKSYLVVGVDFL